MGKRELVLIVGFFVAGLVVYRLTARPAEPSDRGFSMGEVLREVRDELGEPGLRQDVHRSATLRPAAAISSVTLTVEGNLTVIGEDREDLAAELNAAVMGHDERDLEERASRTVLRWDEAGDTATLQIEVETRRRADLDLVLRVPSSFRVQATVNEGKLDARRVASARLDTRRSAVELEGIPGHIEGTVRDDTIEIRRAGAVSLEGSRAQLTLEDIAGPVDLQWRTGSIDASRLKGRSTMRLRRTRAVLEDVHEALSMECERERVTIRDLQGRLLFRGSNTELALALAAPVEIDASTSSADIDLDLPADSGFSIDAQAKGGRIRAPAQLAPASHEGLTSVRGDLGEGGPRILIRTEGGSISIRQ